MSSLSISLISVACIFVGALVGMGRRSVMPKHHLLNDSRVLLISSISLFGAVFLILEMNHPLEGMVKVPAAPMRKALQILHAQMP